MVLVRPVMLVVVLASCGRFGFDPRGDASDLDAPLDASPADPSLEALINFEGTTDDVAKGRTVSCVGGCPSTDAGSRGQVGTFNGSQCLLVPNAPEFETQSFTVALWFRATDLATETMFSKPYMGAMTSMNSVELYKTTTGNVQFVTAGSTGTGAGQFSDELWHHVAATYASRQVRTYFDGAARATATLTASYAGDSLLIGCDIDIDNVTALFVGQLDDVRYYSRALTATEIAALAQ